MKMTSIIKTVVAVTAIVTVGKVVYNKVKANKETESEEVKTIIDEVVEDDEPEPKKNIIEKAVDKFNNLSIDDQALVVSVAGAVVIGLGVIFVGHHYNCSLKNYTNKTLNNSYMSSQKIQDDIEQATNEIMNMVLPWYMDNYITNFFKELCTNKPEAYEYYLNNKFDANAILACYCCNILGNNLLTAEEIKKVQSEVHDEITKIISQEVK